MLVALCFQRHPGISDAAPAVLRGLLGLLCFPLCLLCAECRLPPASPLMLVKEELPYCVMKHSLVFAPW